MTAPAKPYVQPKILVERRLLLPHLEQLKASAIDSITALWAGVYSIEHAQAYDLGIRSRSPLDGICFPYWGVAEQRFSSRYARVRPSVMTSDRKYLQPVGERPRLYFTAGVTQAELANPFLPICFAEGEKKAISVARALSALDSPAVTIGIGGVWCWCWSPKELQPDGKLAKGRSRPIDDLDLVTWKHRKVYLILDSDVTTNPRVLKAETALARELSRRGALVRLVRIPGGDSWVKSESMT